MSDQDTPNTEATEPQDTAAAVATETPTEPTEQLRPLADLPAGTWVRGTGRRKASVARVRIRPGEGEFKINGRVVDEFFSEERDRNDMWAPLEATSTKGRLNVEVTVRGGGPTGQAGAVRLGLSRALRKYDEFFEDALRKSGFLTVDARRVERKKYGQPGARRRFQFSKR